MTPTAAVALALAAGGALFAAVALVGLVRLPDCYSRAHATSKAETLGALLTLGAAGVALGGAAATAKLAVLAAFLLVTGPAAAHAVVRSAHRAGVPPAAGTPTLGVGSGDEGSTPGETADDGNGDGRGAP